MVRTKSPRFMLETVLNVNFYNPVSCWSIRMWHGDVINVSKSSYFPPYQWTESTFHWHMQLQELLKEQRSIKAEFFSSSADSFKGKDLSWKEERIERKCLWLMGGKTVLAIREATISHRASKRSSEPSSVSRKYFSKFPENEAKFPIKFPTEIHFPHYGEKWVLLHFY